MKKSQKCWSSKPNLIESHFISLSNVFWYGWVPKGLKVLLLVLGNQVLLIFFNMFTLLGMVVEITGAHCRVWLLLGQHSICCHSSQALQNGEPYLDKPNVPCLLHHWCHHGDPWNILLIQALQWKVSCLEILSLKSQPSPQGWMEMRKNTSTTVLSSWPSGLCGTLTGCCSNLPCSSAGSLHQF